MRIIYVTPFIRYPPDYGLAVRNVRLIEHLSRRHEVKVVTFGCDDTGETDRWLAAVGDAPVRLPLALPWVSRVSRWKALCSLAEYPAANFRRFSPARLAECLHAQATGRKSADVIVYDTQLTGQAQRLSVLDLPAVLVLADVYTIQNRRRIFSAGLRPYGVFYACEWFKSAMYERRVISRFKNVIAVSPSEQAWLLKHHWAADVKLVPNGVDVDLRCPARASSEKTILFVGNLDYGPNVDAVHRLRNDILPLVRARHPDVRAYIVGGNPPPEIQAYSRRDGSIVVTGKVKDLRPYYSRSSVAVVPLRQGSGVKLKTLEAFGMGVPVVSTDVGLEGIVARDQEHALLADTSESFAAKVDWVLTNRSEAEEMAARARLLVERHHDWRHIGARFEELLEHSLGS